MTNQPGRNDLAGENIVAVFGGTGFLGRRIVTSLLDKAVDVRAISRHPHKYKLDNVSGKKPSQEIEADILEFILDRRCRGWISRGCECGQPLCGAR
ncbi:NAD-dependent epimerase/dehydratase family protein [Rhizobium yanglingense]